MPTPEWLLMASILLMLDASDWLLGGIPLTDGIRIISTQTYLPLRGYGGSALMLSGNAGELFPFLDYLPLGSLAFALIVLAHNQPGMFPGLTKIVVKSGKFSKLGKLGKATKNPSPKRPTNDSIKRNVDDLYV